MGEESLRATGWTRPAAAHSSVLRPKYCHGWHEERMQMGQQHRELLGWRGQNSTRGQMALQSETTIPTWSLCCRGAQREGGAMVLPQKCSLTRVQGSGNQKLTLDFLRSLRERPHPGRTVVLAAAVQADSLSPTSWLPCLPSAPAT